MHSGEVPYFSQWEDSDMTNAVLFEGPLKALLRDTKWEGSGAGNIEEYAKWAGNICGMACLKMVLAAKFAEIYQTIELARGCTSYGGYVVNPETQAIKGLIYAPFVTFIRDRFGLAAEVVAGVTSADLPMILETSSFFIASVHHTIRDPATVPSSKGGHLVLCIRASSEEIVFHNPSGHTKSAQEYVTLPSETFDGFFAGRGIAVA
ncbi:C39 family peptidase [Rhizobium sp. 2YAF20]|uniref:C39 family peptidase n=1 Tax=Rhizobium sp. 2YAF20 TaxID=3233027 RepID=UPI003F94FDDF